MNKHFGKLGGNEFFARVLRGAGWTALGFGASQIIRFGSNLILTRLLFPEAFGLMALITVFMVGLVMFSDIGLSPAILQDQRGDDPNFLNTVWTIQVIRGVCLWLGTCIIALPVAAFYGEPMLAQLLPAAGLTLLVSGLNPTRLDTANRHLMLGRVVLIDLLSQVIGIVVVVLLAWSMRSVWALVIGGVLGAAAKLVLAHVMLSGPANHLLWDRSVLHRLVHFGKWLFLSTTVAFLIAQGDKAILGKYLSLEHLGIYNIGYFLASFPLLLAGAVGNRILIPIYRDRPPAASAENFRKVQLMRFAMTGIMLCLVLAIAHSGLFLVNLLYDHRYAAAGPMVVVIACTQVLQIIGLSYDQAALAAGDSRNFFFLFAARAVVQISFLIIGAEAAGLIGALIGQGLGMLFVHPMIIWIARKHGVWDPLHDVIFAVVGFSLAGLALWHNWPAIEALAGFGRV